jgi:Leucine-rich repeat (LRR) protein
MWYYRTVLAAIEDAINALQSKGVSEDIIQFVHSLPDNQKGKAIGALNQNPLMMIDDLRNLFQLTQLYLSNCELNNINDLLSMTKLIKLDISKN